MLGLKVYITLILYPMLVIMMKHVKKDIKVIKESHNKNIQARKISIIQNSKYLMVKIIQLHTTENFDK